MLGLPNKKPGNKLGPSEPREGMTLAQAAVYDAILLAIEPGLPSEAVAFLPIVRVKLAEKLRSTGDTIILETFDTFLSRAEALFEALHNLPVGEPWKPLN